MENPYEMELVDGKWKLKEWKFTDVYTDLKRQLIEKGIPENIRVLMGSTAKMGAGTNCQNKIIALHHLDCPWRPSDLTQRNR